MASTKREKRAADTPAGVEDDEDQERPPMAVSIAGISTACSKDALVSSAKAVREALSTE